MERTITLTMHELRVVQVLQQLVEHKITNKEAARELGLSVRQVQRKKKRYVLDGEQSVVHYSKGKSSGQGFPPEFKQKIIKIYREEYNGWNFSHFREHLEDDHDIYISQTSVYNILTKAGIKSPKKKRHRPNPHPPRPRRECPGELVQTDASDHKWIELAGVKHHAHGMIDDATGIVLSCVLDRQETIHGYQLAMKDMIKDYGLPECLYADNRDVFKSNKKLTIEEELAGKTVNTTRFGGTLKRLGIGLITTSVPQAKGRIERLWETFQDRLVKELRKEQITSLDEANRYIREVFLPRYNKRHASKIDYTKSKFIPVPQDFNYNIELATTIYRRVNHHSYFQIRNKTFVAVCNDKPLRLNYQTPIEIYECLDGIYRIKHEDKWYKLKEVKRIKAIEPPKPKRSRAEVNASKAHKLSSNHPWRMNRKELYKLGYDVLQH